MSSKTRVNCNPRITIPFVTNFLLLCWEKPEEEVSSIDFVHCEEARVALNVLVDPLKNGGVHPGKIPTCLNISTVNVGGEVEGAAHSALVVSWEWSGWRTWL